MNRNLTTLLCSLIVALYSIYGANTLHAQVQKDSVRIFFYQGRADLDMKLRSNKLELERLLDLCSSIEDTTLYYIYLSRGGLLRKGAYQLMAVFRRNEQMRLLNFFRPMCKKK